MSTYYNDFDPSLAAWLRELTNAGHLPSGTIDSRSINDVDPTDLCGFVHCHFFAGIGGWPLALRLAGWPDDRPVWTGSCPCQPFSCAGKRRGTSDERHLWPEFFRLIRECRPPTVFGEQVASKAGREWLAGVFADLEGVGYAVAGADLCAASVGAPHIRQRLWWVAISESQLYRGWLERTRRRAESANCCPHCGEQGECVALFDDGDQAYKCSAGHRWLANDQRPGLEGWSGESGDTGEKREAVERGGDGCDWNGPTLWHPCRDGKQRRIPAEPALFHLAHGLPGRVGLLRGAGNAIVPQVAAEFVKAALACLPTLLLITLSVATNNGGLAYGAAQSLPDTAASGGGGVTGGVRSLQSTTPMKVTAGRLEPDRQSTYTVTGYCNEGPNGCKICCGKWAKLNRTASGAVPRAGVTCAAPRSIPFGTVLEIEGVGRRIVEDRLSKRFDRRIDVFFRTHAEARRFGKRTLKVKEIRRN